MEKVIEDSVVRLAWQGSEYVRQAVYRECIKSAIKAAKGEKEAACERYITEAMRAIKGVSECQNATPE